MEQGKKILSFLTLTKKGEAAMKKIVLVFAMTLALSGFFPPADASEPLGYPGYTWGSLEYPASVAVERNNLLFDGKIEQGIDWHQYESWMLNTFVDLRYTLDSQGYDWNNRIAPGIGFKFRRAFSQLGVADIGAKYTYESRWKNDANGSGIKVFVNWYFDWNLKKNR